MKKISVVLLICLLIGLTETNVTATTDNGIKIFLDGQQLTLDPTLGKPFIDENNRTQIPLRGVLEAFGAEVSWDDENKAAVIEKEDVEAVVPIGDKVMTKNTEMIVMDTEAVLVDGRTYIPIRVLEVFDAKIDWDDETKSVLIESPPKPLIINTLPEFYDLRTRDRLSAVRDQLDIGACWAFATLGALESALLPNKAYDFSEDHMSLGHGYNLTQDEGGDFQLSLAYLSRWSGPVYEDEDPYGDGAFTNGLKAAIHVQEAMILPKKNFTAIKRAVMEYGGVQTSIHIRDIVGQELGDAYNDETFAFYYKGDQVANHDVVIVGWDDNFPASNFRVQPTRPGAFICRNSYGDLFGDKGYFYVSYEDVLIGTENIVYTKLESNDNYDKIYQSDWLGWVGRIGFGKDTAYFSNIYTSDELEKLEAVSFYATDMDTSYEVYVVDQFTDVSDFAKKTFVTRGFASYAGYYTVDFDVPIEVNGDFAVIVKITTPGSTLPVAAEYDRDVKWLSDVDISDGRGYMSVDGKTWDSTEEVLASNVCLKAFTSKVEQEAVPKESDETVEQDKTVESDETGEVDEAVETEDINASEVIDSDDSTGIDNGENNIDDTAE